MAIIKQGGRYEIRYYGPRLEKIADDRTVGEAMRRMADRGGDTLHELIAMFTPVRTGNLATSWYREPTTEVQHGPDKALQSTVATDTDYAPYVNYGTGLYGPEHRKYLIEPHPPNQLLSWIDPHTGERMYAKRVWHPGSPGEHMIEKAIVFEESTLQETMLPELERWKLAQERVIESSMVGITWPKI
jgi:hypothetical protein